MQFFFTCIELIHVYQTSKAGRQTHNNVLPPKTMNEWRNMEISLLSSTQDCNNCSITITAWDQDDNCCKPQNTPSRNHGQLVVKVMTLLSPFNQWCHLSTKGNFPFLVRWGIHFFPKISKALLFLRSPPPTLSSLLFGADIQFSHDSIHAFNDWIKLWENSGLWKVQDQEGIIHNLNFELPRRRKSSGEQIIECLCLGMNGLIVTPRKFQALKTGVFVLRTDFCGETITYPSSTEAHFQNTWS